MLIYITVFSLSLLFSFMALVSSLVLNLDFFNIFNFFQSLVSQTNLLLLLVFVVLFSVFLSVVFYDLLRREERNYFLLYPFVVLSIFVFVVFGKSFFSFALALFSFFVAVVVYSVYFGRKEIYKVVPYEKLVSGASKAFLTYIFLFISVMVGYYAYHNPHVYESSIQEFLYKSTGMNMSDINKMESELSREQYRQSYAFAKNIEDYILYGIYTNAALEGQEKVKCLRAVNESMSKFDNELKKQLSQQVLDSKARESVDRIKNMLAVISKIYPLILAATLFFALQVITLLVGIFTYLITSFLKGFY